MKIQGSDYDTIVAAVTVLDTDDLRSRYIEAYDSDQIIVVSSLDVRYRWDLLWRAKIDRDILSNYKSSHIDTVLRKVVPTLGRG